MAGEVGICADEDERDASLREDAWPVAETVPFAARDDATLDGLLPSRNSESPLIGVKAFQRQRHSRDRRPAMQAGLDHYLVQLLTAEWLQRDVNDKHSHTNVGDICIVDLAQMPKSQIEAGPMMALAMPRQALEKAVGARNLHGTVLKAQWAMTPLIASMLRELCSLDAPLPDAQAMAVQEAVIALLSAALKGDVQGDDARVSPLGAGLRQRIVEFITHNVHLLELSPGFLCRRFKVSRAHLYRAFAGDGGVAKVLRDIRLDAAYRELAGTARTSRSVTEIAYSLGFSSGNQLLRCFRARFGMTPSQARAGEHA